MPDYESLPEDLSYRINDGQEAGDALAEFERRVQARTIAVPTDDGRIKIMLIELGEPIILFAESVADRRERLRYLLSTQEGIRIEGQEYEEEDEEYYTDGGGALLSARRRIAEYALHRAAARNRMQKAQHTVPLAKQLTYRRGLVKSLRTYVNQGSQIAGDRPVAIARFSPDSATIATGSWAGDVSLFSADSLVRSCKLVGHQDKVGGLAWHPRGDLLLSGGGEGDICLWDIKTEKPVTMTGHGARVVRTEFHPSGDYFASASFDGTWRLWSTETQKELLLQQGHSHEVYTVSFHNDGSLLASGGLDAIGRVWDLRSGKTIMVLDGHVKSIQGLSFSANGYHLASASADDTIKIWDLRQIKCTHTIPAHKSLVSDIRFHNARIDYVSDGIDQDSAYLVSSGYDGAVNIWSASDWSLVASLQGMDEKKVMSVDLAPDGQSICASSWDRTLRLWKADSFM